MVSRTTTGSRRRSERGFTLAGVLVVLTVLMVFVAYTVPKQWSRLMQRERERQTIYAMQQYARAIREFNKRHQAYPVSIDQLKEARLPRFIRNKGEFVDPLTGQVDWLIIPASAAPTTNAVSPGGGLGGARGENPTGGGTGNSNTNNNTGSKTSTTEPGGVPSDPNTPPGGQNGLQGIPLKDYAGGPFIGVRPAKTGDSMIEFRGAKSYEQWSYTSVDLETEINLRQQAAATLYH